MANANEIFAEAVSVVPLVHAPVRQNQNALIIGSRALPAAGLAARYPSFVDIAVVGASIDRFEKNRRIRKIASLNDLQQGWKADLIVIAEPDITDEHIKMARAASGQDSVVVFAVNEFSGGGAVRTKIIDQWKNVVPYREHLPRPALFIMASDSPLKQQRKVPDGTSRMQKSYIPSLFILAKDEYQTLYGAR
jgi:hypothetical protein